MEENQVFKLGTEINVIRENGMILEGCVMFTIAEDETVFTRTFIGEYLAPSPDKLLALNCDIKRTKDPEYNQMAIDFQTDEASQTMTINIINWDKSRYSVARSGEGLTCHTVKRHKVNAFDKEIWIELILWPTKDSNDTLAVTMNIYTK